MAEDRETSDRRLSEAAMGDDTDTLVADEEIKRHGGSKHFVVLTFLLKSVISSHFFQV